MQKRGRRLSLYSSYYSRNRYRRRRRWSARINTVPHHPQPSTILYRAGRSPAVTQRCVREMSDERCSAGLACHRRQKASDSTARRRPSNSCIYEDGELLKRKTWLHSDNRRSMTSTPIFTVASFPLARVRRLAASAGVWYR